MGTWGEGKVRITRINQVKHGKCKSFLRFVACLLAWLAAARIGNAQKIVITPAKASCVYDIGEPIAWKVEVTGDNASSIKQVNYALKECGLKIIKHGVLDLSSGSASLDTSLSEPGTVLLVITTTIADKPVRVLAGAAVAPSKVQPTSPRPDDFDQFWSDKIKELEAIPANPQLEQIDIGNPDVKYFKIRMDNIHGTHIYGQLAMPAAPGKYPALLIPQWAGVYGLPKSRPWSIGHDRAGSR